MGDIAIVKFFNANHIELQEKWLENAIQYIIQAKKAKSEEMKAVNMVGYVYEQWLYAEISQSTTPKLRIPTNASKLAIVTKFPLQIMSVVDISKPLYGQYKSIVDRAAVNNSEFQSEVDYEEEEAKMSESKREVLHLVLSDGKTTVNGLQYSPIPGLTRKTPPGTKAFIIGKTMYRKGCLMLTDKNFQILGGDSADLAVTNSLVHELATRLRIDSSHVKVSPTLPPRPEDVYVPQSVPSAAGLPDWTSTATSDDTLKAVDGTLDRTTSNRLFDCPPAPQVVDCNSNYRGSQQIGSRILSLPPQALPPGQVASRSSMNYPVCDDTLNLKAADGTLDRTTSSRLSDCPREPQIVDSNSNYRGSQHRETRVPPLPVQARPPEPQVIDANSKYQDSQHGGSRRLPPPPQALPLNESRMEVEGEHQSAVKQHRKRPKTIVDHFRRSESGSDKHESFTSHSSTYVSSDPDISIISDTDMPARKHRIVEKSNGTLNTTNGTAMSTVALRPSRAPRKPPVTKSDSSISQKQPRPSTSESYLGIGTGNSNFNDTTLGEAQRPSLLEDMRIPAEEALVPFTNQPPSIVDYFRKLGIVPLTEVLKQKRFWLKPETRIILPILCESSRDIGTAQDQWSLLVYLSDENIERVEMVLQNDLLVELLGFTVQHCKQLSDAGKQAELMACKDRAIQILSIFKRLDLVFTVEFSPLPNMTPIVKKVENLGRSLKIC